VGFVGEKGLQISHVKLFVQAGATLSGLAIWQADMNFGSVGSFW
jgi:hypothetical protein